MALVTVGPVVYPDHRSPGPGASHSSQVIDATGEKVAFVGQIWYPGTDATKAIERVQFRFGTVVKAGGSALTVSLQDVSTTTGPPAQPDGTQDQTVAIANANASFASNTWIRTGTLSANRTVAIGDWLAVVIEFDGSGRLGSDSVAISHTLMPATTYNELSGSPLLNTGSWALGNGLNCVILEFSDGTFGTFYGNNFPASAFNSTAVNSTTTDYSMRFRLPFDCEIDGLMIHASFASTAACDIRLMSDDASPSVIQTYSMDVNMLSGISASRPYTVPIPLTTLTRNTWYHVAIRPTVAANVTYYNFDVNDANHLSVHTGGIDCHYATRTSGAWTTTTTKRPLFGVRIVSINDTASSGGGSGVTGVIGG